MGDKPCNYLKHSNNETHTNSHGDDNHSNLDHERHGHDHTHSEKGTLYHGYNLRKANSKLLLSCLIVTITYSVIEGIGGYLTHSIALKTDAIHMLTDAVGLLIAYFANSISSRPATTNLSFGFGKAEAIGALINCIFTIILTAGLFVEAIMRFFNPVIVEGSGLFIIATIGLIINLGVISVLSKNLGSLNIKAAFIHALGDMLGSLVAIIAGLIIYLTGFFLADPILSLFIIAFMLISNYNIVKKSIAVLMAGVPEHLDYNLIGKELEQVVGVISVHDLHIWYMDSDKAALSAHLVIKDPIISQQILIKCQEMLEEKYQIEHVTIQHELAYT